MTFQTTVNKLQALGVVGDFYDESPKRVAPYNIINNSTAATTATGSIVVGETAPSADDTVNVGGQIYTFVAALTAATTAGQVLIGANATASAANLVAAINKATGGGTTYGSNTTKNLWTSAAVDAQTATTINLTALSAGQAGNNIALVENLTPTAASVVAFAGGADAISALPYVGHAYTATANAGEAIVGGSGAFQGVLVNSKEYANYTGSLAPQAYIQNNSVGQLCTMGHIIVQSATDVSIGNVAAFIPATGQINAYANAAAAGVAGATVITNAKFVFVTATAANNELAIVELT